jgi:hypothetical protein
MPVITFPESPKLQKEIEGLFQVLPFNTRLEGARKLSKELGYRITVPRLTHLMNVVRDDPNRWLYSIPRTKQGRRGKNEPDAPRYICVMKDSSGQPYFNAGEMQQLRGGNVSIVAHLVTMTRRHEEALKLALAYLETTSARRQARIVRRQLARTREDVEDLQALLEEENDNGVA